jgi:hypothetical protein
MSTTPINGGSSALSCMMSDMQSLDDGPETEFNFGDFNEKTKSLAIQSPGQKMRVNRPPTDGRPPMSGVGS